MFHTAKSAATVSVRHKLFNKVNLFTLYNLTAMQLVDTMHL